MGRKKLTWKHVMSSCRQVESPRIPEPKKQGSLQGSFRRISISDVSDSPIPIDELSKSMGGSKLYVFTYGELRVMTHRFSWNNLLGEGGFGPVYKGFADNKLRPGLEAQPVAVKSLNLDGSQGHREWLAEIVILGQLVHPHIVKLIGYCCQDEHRLLIYEYMPRGSLENQLFRRYSAALPWSTRMKIALGAARGLAFLHEGDNPVIYRDFKASNILLDSDYTAKLSDFGLAKDGLEGDDTNASVCIMGTKGYVAPEYVTTGHLTTKSDVYSFGVVLLELITGKRSWDKIRPTREQSLVAWARPLLKDPGRLGRVIDPRLEGQFSTKGAQKAATLACKCLSNNPKSRPRMAHVVKVLESLQDFDDGLVVPFVYTVPSTRSEGEGKDGDGVSGDCAEGRNNGCYNLVQLGHHGWRHKVKLPLSLLAYSPSYIHKNFGDDIYI